MICPKGFPAPLISIHAPRTGSDGEIDAQGNFIAISIHAPRTGSDATYQRDVTIVINFNPRSPHGERRQKKEFRNIKTGFQSTLPARGATRWRRRLLRRRQFQSRLPARGATFEIQYKNGDVTISIHAPRTGSDRRQRVGTGAQSDFNPRSPHGERPLLVSGGQGIPHFNPRSPHGERLVSGLCSGRALTFQSTLPARGATIGRETGDNV